MYYREMRSFPQNTVYHLTSRHCSDKLQESLHSSPDCHNWITGKVLGKQEGNKEEDGRNMGGRGRTEKERGGKDESPVLRDPAYTSGRMCRHMTADRLLPTNRSTNVGCRSSFIISRSVAFVIKLTLDFNPSISGLLAVAVFLALVLGP